MLVTRIFSFSNNVFHHLKENTYYLSNIKTLPLSKCLQKYLCRSVNSRVVLDFLAHLRTKCSGWAIVINHCPASVPSVCPSVREHLLNKIFSSETGQQISIKLHKNDPWVMHFQKTSQIWIPCKRKKNIKNLLVPNHNARAFIFGM